jgi:hypothetical protein
MIGRGIISRILANEITNESLMSLSTNEAHNLLQGYSWMIGEKRKEQGFNTRVKTQGVTLRLYS